MVVLAVLRVLPRPDQHWERQDSWTPEGLEDVEPTVADVIGNLLHFILYL